MGQRKITIEFTEYQARMLRWAIRRATMVAPRAARNSTPWRKLLEVETLVLEATDGLPDAPVMPAGASRR